MSKRVAILALTIVSVIGSAIPGRALRAPYTKAYVGSTYGLLIVQSNPSDFGNPARLNKPVQQQVSYTGLSGDVDAAVGTAYTTWNGAPNPLAGSAADKNHLRGTPADRWAAGAIFSSFSGIPNGITITDEVAATTGSPIAWLAAQCTKKADPCPGADTNDVFGCTPSGKKVKIPTTLFRTGAPVYVYILTTDPVPVWLQSECEGAAGSGTITLHTTATS